MTIKINKNKCIGCGLCESLCSSNFKINDNGKATVISQKNTKCVENAIENCPVQAIKLM